VQGASFGVFRKFCALSLLLVRTHRQLYIGVERDGKTRKESRGDPSQRERKHKRGSNPDGTAASTAAGSTHNRPPCWALYSYHASPLLSRQTSRVVHRIVSLPPHIIFFYFSLLSLPLEAATSSKFLSPRFHFHFVSVAPRICPFCLPPRIWKAKLFRRADPQGSQLT
jgi:hypothetical protein